MNKLSIISVLGIVTMTLVIVITSVTPVNFQRQTSFDSHLGPNDSGAKTFGSRIRLKDGTSLNWAGYAVETNLSNPQNHAVSDVNGQWVVSAVTCSSANTYSATWVGIDGYADNTVEQTGTEQDCINGNPSYSAWYEFYPKPSHSISLAVNPGDTMSAEVKYIGSNKFTVTLTDITTGDKFSITQKANGLRQSAEWIVEAPSFGGVLPLADFGTIPFSSASATLNGHLGTINDSTWQYEAITMTNSSGKSKATPSPLTSDGTSFNVTWNSN